MTDDIVSFLLTCASKALADGGKSTKLFITPQMFSVDQLPNLFVSIKDIGMELKDKNIISYHVLATVDNVNRYPTDVMDIVLTKDDISININGKSNIIHSNMLGRVGPEIVREIVYEAVNNIPELADYVKKEYSVTINETIKEILTNAGLGKQPNPYANVYFIKSLNPGDGISLFVCFRFKTTKKEVLLCRVNIDLALTSNNVSMAISLMTQPMIKRESITFFRQRLSIRGKSIMELLNGVVLDTFVEKIEKVEDYYKQESG